MLAAAEDHLHTMKINRGSHGAELGSRPRRAVGFGDRSPASAAALTCLCCCSAAPVLICPRSRLLGLYRLSLSPALLLLRHLSSFFISVDVPAFSLPVSLSLVPHSVLSSRESGSLLCFFAHPHASVSLPRTLFLSLCLCLPVPACVSVLSANTTPTQSAPHLPVNPD